MLRKRNIRIQCEAFGLDCSDNELDEIEHVEREDNILLHERIEKMLKEENLWKKNKKLLSRLKVAYAYFVRREKSSRIMK